MDYPSFIMWTCAADKPALAVIKPYDGKAATVGNGTMVALVMDSKEKVNALYAKAMELGGKVEPDDLRITVGRQLAIVQNHEKGTNINAPGKPGAVSIRATSIFRKEAGQWKMIGHHTDLLPYLKR